MEYIGQWPDYLKAEFLPTASAATGTVSQIIASAVMDQNGQDSVIDCQLP